MTTHVQTVSFADFGAPNLPITLDFHSAPLSDEQFEELCRNNRDMKFEISARGELIIVAPTSPESGCKNSELTADVTIWSRKDGTGIVFDSSTLFTFPNGAKRSPDVSWMSKDRWNTVIPAERRKFAKVVPEFVIELLSPTDSLAATHLKMEEYIENGVLLGWLIDPMAKQIRIYRANGEVQILDNPETVSGEDVLKGFELNIRGIF